MTDLQSNKQVLLEIQGLKIEGYSDEKWNGIVHGGRPDPAPRRGSGTDR